MHRFGRRSPEEGLIFPGVIRTSDTTPGQTPGVCVDMLWRGYVDQSVTVDHV